MVEVSRDGRRVYLSNSLYSSWDAHLYPDGIRGWVAKFDTKTDGGMSLDPRFFTRFDDALRRTRCDSAAVTPRRTRIASAARSGRGRGRLGFSA